MTAAVGSDLGVGIELGAGFTAEAQAGSALGPMTTGPDGGWNLNLQSAVSGSPGSGLTSAVQNFRSSWQSAVNACRGEASGIGGMKNGPADASRGDETLDAPMQRQAVTGLQRHASAQPGPLEPRSHEAQAQQIASARNRPSQVNVQLSVTQMAAEVRAAAAAIGASASDFFSAQEQSSVSSRDRIGSPERTGSAEKTARKLDARGSVKRQSAAPALQTAAPPVVSPLPAPALTLRFPEQNVKKGSAPTRPGQEGAASRAAARYSKADISPGATAAAYARQVAGLGAADGLHGTAQSQTARTAKASSQDEAAEIVPEMPPHSLSATGGALGSQDRSMPPGADPKTGGLPQSVSAENSENHPEASAANPGSVQTDASAVAKIKAGTDAGTVRDRSKPAVEYGELRSAAHSVSSASVSGATQAVAVRAVSAAVVASAGVHVPASTYAAMASTANHAEAASTSVPTSARDPFSALDAGTSPGTPMWTSAGAQHAEAGFRDPDLGWIGVRADLSAGSVHATLVPGSTEAAQSLSGHLAGLATHLTEQRAPIASLSMASPGDGGIGSGAGRQMQQGAGGNAESAAQQGQHAASVGAAVQGATPAPELTAQRSSVSDAVLHAGASSGTHISVVA